MFRYKTGDDSNPQDRQKVYFTCHPEDFDTYFDKVIEQIFKYENCVIWYAYPEETYQDIETDLGQMNLFVIPVTTKLLTTKNRTMDIDVPFALEKHIPIFPLMQENGLDELFRRKFGDCLYAAPDLSDAEKEYIRLKIICEEQYSGNENAHAGYLAEEMKTEKSRRDLSISYELLGDLLSQDFGDIFSAATYYRKSMELREELTKETVESRRELASIYGKVGYSRKEFGFPDEAEYYALLSMELCKELAKELRTEESRRDLLKIYEILGDISKDNYDFYKAESYYLKCLELRRELAEEKKTVKSRRDLMIAYGTLGNICRTRGDSDEAEAYYAKALELSEELAKESATIGRCHDLSVSYTNYGDICYIREDLARAELYYRKALALREELAKERETQESRQDLAKLYDNLEYICRVRGDHAQAAEYCAKLKLYDKDNWRFL